MARPRQPLLPPLNAPLFGTALPCADLEHGVRSGRAEMMRVTTAAASPGAGAAGTAGAADRRGRPPARLQGGGRPEVAVGEEDVPLAAAAAAEKGRHRGRVLNGLIRLIVLLLPEKPAPDTG